MSNNFRIIGPSLHMFPEFAEFIAMSVASLGKGRQLPVAYPIFESRWIDSGICVHQLIYFHSHFSLDHRFELHIMVKSGARNSTGIALVNVIINYYSGRLRFVSQIVAWHKGFVCIWSALKRILLQLVLPKLLFGSIPMYQLGARI